MIAVGDDHTSWILVECHDDAGPRRDRLSRADGVPGHSARRRRGPRRAPCQAGLPPPSGARCRGPRIRSGTRTSSSRTSRKEETEGGGRRCTIRRSTGQPEPPADLYQSHLRALVHDRTGLEWGKVSKGQPELVAVRPRVLKVVLEANGTARERRGGALRRAARVVEEREQGGEGRQGAQARRHRRSHVARPGPRAGGLARLRPRDRRPARARRLTRQRVRTARATNRDAARSRVRGSPCRTASADARSTRRSTGARSCARSRSTRSRATSSTRRAASPTAACSATMSSRRPQTRGETRIAGRFATPSTPRPGSCVTRSDAPARAPGSSASRRSRKPSPR